MKRTKNNFLLIILSLLFWGALGYLVFALSPNSPIPFVIPANPKLIFFVLLFLASYFSFSLLMASGRRGFLIALAIVSLALLRYFSLFHALYIILIFAILITVEIYFSTVKPQNGQKRLRKNRI